MSTPIFAGTGQGKGHGGRDPAGNQPQVAPRAGGALVQRGREGLVEPRKPSRAELMEVALERVETGVEQPRAGNPSLRRQLEQGSRPDIAAILVGSAQAELARALEAKQLPDFVFQKFRILEQALP